MMVIKWSKPAYNYVAVRRHVADNEVPHDQLSRLDQYWVPFDPLDADVISVVGEAFEANVALLLVHWKTV